MNVDDLSHTQLKESSEKYPEFKKYLLKNRFIKKSVKAWRNLLLQKPKFESIAWYCPKGAVALLSLKPELAQNFDWKLDFLYDDRVKLLMYQPQFVDKCDSDKFRDFDAFLNWLPLLMRQPSLGNIAEKYSDGRIAMLIAFSDYAEKYDEYDSLWRHDKFKVIQLRPELMDKFSTLEDIRPHEWKYLMTSNSDFVEVAKKYYNGLTALIRINPANTKLVKDWRVFTIYQWVEILQQQPQLREEFEAIHKWSELSTSEWIHLLMFQPEFANMCDKFADMSPTRRKWLLKCEPSLEKYFPQYVLPRKEKVNPINKL